MKVTLRIAAVLVLMIFIIKVTQWWSQEDPEPKVITKVIEKRDTIYLPTITESMITRVQFPDLTDSIEKLKRELISTNTDTIIKTDTIYKYIALDYFAMRFYDTLLIDTTGLKANLSFKVQRNKAQDLKFTYTLFEKETTIIQPEKKRNHLYLGGGVQWDGKPFISLDYALRNRVMLGGGLGQKGTGHIKVSYKLW